jgi:nicotinate-nucleotide pyrophosphorylase (carboxylating)
MNQLKMRQRLQQFFDEDFGEQDITSMSLFRSNDIGEGTFVVKEDGVIAGLNVVREGYKLLHPEIDVTMLVRDGDTVRAGDDILTIRGPIQELLGGERVLLNLLQRMSGIATITNDAVQKLNSDHTRICDTRKTTPGLRMFEKYAVTCGGGYNHRFGLYDGVMIKDNHIAYTGSISAAVEKVRQRIGHMIKIEVETETKEQVIEAVEAGADVIMFDNRSPDEIIEWIPLVPNSIVTEASGGITVSNVHDYRTTMVDYISLGFITHSAKALDISFNI